MNNPGKRWNGWGDDRVEYPLSESAIEFLEGNLGPGSPMPDAPYQKTLETVPDSRLPRHPLITLEPADRLAHARGQSLPDWIALRSGRIGGFPDGVAYPSDNQEIRNLFEFGHQVDAVLIPYGGGTSVVGHINPTDENRPSLSIDLHRIAGFLDLDKSSLLGTFGSGITGPHLEAALNQEGFTLGHFPQSWEYSTLGGWIATRSCGQQSLGYGRIEELFAGGQLETPGGPWTIPHHPASAAGPDLRQLVLGSEGRLGIITQATVRIRPLPEEEAFYGAFFKCWQDGLQAVKVLAQSEIQLSMLRLSDPSESQTSLALSGHDRWLGLLEHGLQSLGYRSSRCLLIYGLTGGRSQVEGAQRHIRATLRAYGALYSGGLLGVRWQRSRFRTPYLRNTLWDLGYALDTLETAVSWSQIPNLVEELRATLSSGLESEGERVLALIHLSHVYRDGASIYLTYLFRRKADPDLTLTYWTTLKSAANEIILAAGGTISHQHGIGLDHLDCLQKEKDEIGMRVLRNVIEATDPTGMMNPDKLIRGQA